MVAFIIDYPQCDVSGLFLINDRFTLYLFLQESQSRGFGYAGLEYYLKFFFILIKIIF
jgi:hypothetical protein